MVPNKPFIFLVEHNVADAELVHKVLEKDGLSANLFIASSIEGVIALRDDTKIPEPDIIILDLNLPNGFNKKNYLEVQELFPGAPIIIIGDESFFALGNNSGIIRDGAVDYVFKKNILCGELATKIRYVLTRSHNKVKRPLFQSPESSDTGAFAKIKTDIFNKFFIPIAITLAGIGVTAYLSLNYLPRKEAETTYVRKDLYTEQFRNLTTLIDLMNRTLIDNTKALQEMQLSMRSLTERMDHAVDRRPQ